MKLSVDHTRMIVFVVALVCATVLVAMGKLSVDKLGLFLPWLMPSPLLKDAVKVKEEE